MPLRAKLASLQRGLVVIHGRCAESQARSSSKYNRNHTILAWKFDQKSRHTSSTKEPASWSLARSNGWERRPERRSSVVQHAQACSGAGTERASPYRLSTTDEMNTAYVCHHQCLGRRCRIRLRTLLQLSLRGASEYSSCSPTPCNREYRATTRFATARSRAEAAHAHHEARQLGGGRSREADREFFLTS